MLRDGVDAIREVPRDRWNVDELYDPRPATPAKMNTRWGGFLDQVDQFDAQFFGVSGREAERMDPQQRLLLEVVWESLENAGLAVDQLAGSQTGVFVGISNSDYSRLLFRGLAGLSAYSATGTSLSIAANRISYLLNLRGPSVAIDTACSSSLVAVHLACQSLTCGESVLCVAGGVNVILTPEGTVTFSQARMMASDGRCKTFDARADGYVRGEGCGVVVLKRLADALRDGDRIEAVILGSAVNQDGLSNGLTAPHGPAQQAVIRRALRDAGVDPADVSYIEAHGTGTALGDPIEVRSLASVLMPDRPPHQTCWIGSVKTNVGHLESAAGIAGLLKLILALQHHQIPPNLHLEKLNPYIVLEGKPLAIPTQLVPWTTSCSAADRRRQCLWIRWNQLPHDCRRGASGAAAQGRHRASLAPADIARKTPAALRDVARTYSEYLQAHTDVPLADICFTANTGRCTFRHRAAVAAAGHRSMCQQLDRLAGSPLPDDGDGQAAPAKKPLVAFLLTGQGSQYAGMGGELYRTQPTFRKALQDCDELLRQHLSQPLLSVLYPDDASSALLEQATYTQPALFSLEYALYQVWRWWGIAPDFIAGHSVGEYVAACAAEVFSLEDALKLIAARARLMQALPESGQMVAVSADPDQVALAIEPLSKDVSIAAINSPRQVVVSGRAAALDLLVVQMQSRGIKTQRLKVSHAFHSPLMEPMLGEFEQVAREIQYAPPKLTLVSNLTGQPIGEEIATAEYWRRHARQTVRFADSIATLQQAGCRVVVELGPQPVLSALGRTCVTDPNIAWLPSLRQGRGDWEVLLGSLAELFCRGAEVDWRGYDAAYERRRIALPTYPFQRQRHWAPKSCRGRQTAARCRLPRAARISGIPCWAAGETTPGRKSSSRTRWPHTAPPIWASTASLIHPCSPLRDSWKWRWRPDTNACLDGR